MPQLSRPRIVPAIAAVTGFAGLVLQLVLIVQNLGLSTGVWRFLGYFTILTNLAAASVAAAVAAGRPRGLGDRRAQLMAATAMVIVGLVYSLALRSLWNPQGAQKVADILLHDAAPLLWLLIWSLAPPARLSWRDWGWALIPAAAYCAYALSRGALDGWYAYWFLDPTQQSLTQIVTSAIVLLAVFGVTAGVLIAMNRWLQSASPQESRRNRVDEASMESFPASDPPSWTLGPSRFDR